MIVYIVTIIYWVFLSLTVTYQRDRLMIQEGDTAGASFYANRNRLLVLSLLPIYLLMALKSTSVGADTHQYMLRYEEAERMLGLVSYKSEFGYNYLGYLFHNLLHFPWQIYLAIVSAFVCIVFGVFIKKYSVNVLFSAYIHLTIGLFTMSMSGIRQMLAISLCLIGLMILHEKQKEIKSYIFAAILVAIAITIHNSAVCFIPILFITSIRLTKVQAYIVNIIAVICGMFFRSQIVRLAQFIIPARYAEYNLDSGYAINWLVIAITIVIPAFCLVCSFVENDGRYDAKMSTMFIFSALNILFTFLAINNGQIARLAYYFQPTYLVIIPLSIRRFSPHSRKLAIYVISIICLISFMMGTINGTLRIDNYTFFWN